MPEAKILIVDDTRANLVALKVLLKSIEANIVAVESGEQALLTAERDEDHIALILLDVQMPLMDGFEVARQLHENEKTRSIPIIFITANQDEEQLRVVTEFLKSNQVTLDIFAVSAVERNQSDTAEEQTRGSGETLSLDDLDGKKVAVVSGYVWQDRLANEHPEIELVPAPDIATGLQMTSFGIVDARQLDNYAPGPLFLN